MAIASTPTPPSVEVLRDAIRRFLADAAPPSTCDAWLRGFDPELSRELGRQGWIGMMVPREWGGRGFGYVERYVVMEELLAAGAPVAYHWFADRQIAPTLLASGNERLQRELLPRICRGELCFCIGISEPNAGSDVSAIATRATPQGDDWVVDGQKVWTTGAQHAQYCHLVARTDRHQDDPHRGLTEFVVPMDAPGITVRPIEDLSGEAHFAEIFFDGVVVEGWRMIGERGEGFRQIARQLDYERSGPERFSSTLPLLQALLDHVRREALTGWEREIGELLARLAALRAMSLDVARAMDGGAPPSAGAALVKDLGATFEQDVVTVAREVIEDVEPAGAGGVAPLSARLAEALLHQASFTLRGGTAEVLREIVARRMLGLGRSS
ncbi:MAG: acyl-CoA dehydrogenase family protein [Solirubrobacteraceae bacterium]